MLGKKKVLAIIAIAVIIISVCAVGVWYSMQPKAGMKIAIESVEEGENGLEINVLVIPSDSGEGLVKIMYDSLEMYSGPINIVNGKCTAVVSYNEFVTDNGNYTINVTFKDKSDEKIHTVKTVRKDIFITVEPKYDTQSKIDVVVWPSGLPGTNVKVTIKKQDGSVLPGADNTTLDCVEIEGKVSHYEKEIPYTHSGYYKIYATLTNPVKSDSEYLEITEYLGNGTGGDLNLIDLPPEVTVYPQDITIYSRDNGTFVLGDAVASEGWVHFASTDNAENIYNEVIFSAVDYDGSISAAWDIGYNWTTENSTWINDTRIGDDFWYNYPKVEEGGAIKHYTVKLCVYDEHFMSETCEFTITVRY